MQCPQCHHEVPVNESQHGALFTCPKCMAVYFVNFDGSPEYGIMELPDVSLNGHRDNFDAAGDVLTDEAVPSRIIPEDILNANVIHGDDTSPYESPIPTFLNASAQAESAEPSAIPSSNDWTFPVGDIPLKPDSAKQNDGSAFGLVAQEISDYGNQQEVVSSISYDLLVRGLDTKETLSHFKEAIEDAKFSWDVKNIMSQIKAGECRIKNLNPIQAFVLAQRIRFLDLEFKWEQHAAF